MEKPICGTWVRLDWLKNELYKFLEYVLIDTEKNELICWYFSYGLSMGFDKNTLIENIKLDKEIYDISKLLTDEEISRGKKPPLLRKGYEVEVVVNAKNITYHRGIIYDLKWHGNEKEWFYHIYENDKKISKRYYERDLILISK